MNCVVCTLFERDYHFGVAVLVNSLCRAGFKGTVCAGFRGPLPPWTQGRLKTLENGQWEMAVMPDVRLLFLQLDTPAHLTNFKPDFLLQVEAIPGLESETVIYCDPDIVIESDWRFFEDWLSCGVALCEDVNSPLAENNPRRVGWRRSVKPFGFELNFRASTYANGGFIGLSWQHRKLLTVWQELITHAADALGGKDIVGIQGGRQLPGLYGFGDCFRMTDQDALNAALEACPEIPASFLGRHAMGFDPGFALLPHALGPLKPWRRHYVWEALSGFPPTPADKAYWDHVDGPIRPFGFTVIFYKRLGLTLGAALGRFIRRT